MTSIPAVPQGNRASSRQAKCSSDKPTTCVFCERIEKGDYVDRFANWVWFEPLNPVVKGHMLVVPVVHTANLNDGSLEADQTGWALRYFTNAIEGDYNLITSKGEAATQTIQHLHFHIVPRSKDDGLTLPWTGQHTDSRANTNHKSEQA